MKQTLVTSSEADPHVLARRIAMKVPDENVRDALASALADRVRVEIGRQRMVIRSGRPVTAGQYAGVEDAPVTGRSRWARHLSNLDMRVCARGEWKTLGDCTAEDLDALGEDHRERSEREATLAATFRGYAVRMRSAGVSRFHELDSILGEAAA